MLNVKGLSERTSAALSDKNYFLLLSALGYLSLLFIHLKHSGPWLLRGELFPNLGYAAEDSPVAEVAEILTLTYLFALYFLSLSNWSRLQFRVRDQILMGAVLTLIAGAALPANSADIFAYIGVGRLVGVYGVSPYHHVHSEFYDSFSPFAWSNDFLPYGPVVLPIFTVVGLVSQYSLFAAIYGLKLVWILIHGCNVWLLYTILKPWRPDPGFHLFLFIFNPLILLELIINAHVDVLLIMFALLVVLALQRGRYVTAVCMAMLAALVKLPALLLWAAVLIYLTRRRRWVEMAWGAAVSAAAMLLVAVALFSSLREAAITLATTRWTYAFNSLQSLLIHPANWLIDRLDLSVRYDYIFSVQRKMLSAAFLIFCCWRLYRVRDLSSLVDDVASLLLGLLLGYAAFFWPWYATWLLPFAAMTDSRRLRRTILTFSFTVLSLYIYFPHFVPAGKRWMWMCVQMGLAHGIPLCLAIRYWMGRTTTAEGQSAPG